MSEEEPGARTLPTAGDRLPSSTTTPNRNLTGDESERQPRKDSYLNGFGNKDGLHSSSHQARLLSPSPAPSSRLSLDSQTSTSRLHGGNATEELAASPRNGRLRNFWVRNKGAILVALSQLFGALMNLSARLLELEGDKIHPVQALLMRQGLTSLMCMMYMAWTKTSDGPFGHKSLRWLLLLRGCGGFFGIYGMWYSMMYLPLADATVITFLAPGIAGLVCYFVLKEPFTRIEQLATFVALLGVVLIAKPTTLFAKHDPTTTEPSEGAGSLPDLDHEATPEERLVAIGMALLGVLGAACAYTTLRVIGKRASPIISVNAFGLCCTLICTVILVAAPYLDISQPALQWSWPTSLKSWFLLLTLGVLGFGLQYLLTAGLAADKSNRANAMVYTHMLFAAAFDRWVFHHEMSLTSIGGCTLILGSAVGVVLTKKSTPAPKTADDVERQGNLVGGGERSPMLVGVGGNGDDLPLERLR